MYTLTHCTNALARRICTYTEGMHMQTNALHMRLTTHLPTPKTHAHITRFSPYLHMPCTENTHTFTPNMHPTLPVTHIELTLCTNFANITCTRTHTPTLHTTTCAHMHERMHTQLHHTYAHARTCTHTHMHPTCICICICKYMHINAGTNQSILIMNIHILIFLISRVFTYFHSTTLV
ncbi:hypothetical protein niasHT_030140 [Heterodera trifolii]|uniref:Uncharacterized protein n=1 Tax=Heterodera trifolii TaxID=157864 RepID=A0ABD2KLZ7_9BILA